MATSSEGTPPEVIPSGEVPSVPEAPKKRPWGKIAAIVIVIVVIIAAVAIVLRPQNQAPTITQATASAEAVDVGSSITFTAQASDPDGDALTYTWNFGDGSANGTGASVNHAYSLPGRFITLLTVSDGRGASVTNDGNLLYSVVKLKASDVAAPAACPSGATTNSAFSSNAKGWTYAPWEGTSANAFGAYASKGGALGGHLNVTTNFTASSVFSGYWYQSFSYDGSTPLAARLRVGYSVLAFGATGGNATFYAFVDSTSGAPTLGQQVWNSTLKTGTTAWTNATGINVGSKLTAKGTYYLKIAMRTKTALTGTATTGGFDNVELTWSATGCPPGPVVAVLSADQSAIQTGTKVKFSANSSWSYAFAWNDPTDHSLGGGYSVVTGAQDNTLFTQFAYSWGDGTAQTTGTANSVGQTTHTFSSVGSFFVKLTATYSNANLALDVPASTVNAVAGYTVRVVAATPAAQVKYPDIFTTATFGEPDYLDPAVDYETAGGEVLQNVYETLLWYQQGTQDIVNLTPRLATAIPTIGNGLVSPDGMNYTFNLLQNVTFHDGSHMTAADVAYSFSRAMAIHDPDGPSWIIEQFLTNYVAGYADTTCGKLKTPCTVGNWTDDTFASRAAVPATMRAALPAQSAWDTTVMTASLAWAVTNTSVSGSGYKVVFHLTHPYAAFLQAISFTVGSVVSKSCVEANGGVQWATHNEKMDRGTIAVSGDCGTGPYKVQTWEPNQVIIMTRFDSYWRTPAKIKEVHIAKVQDLSTRELMLLAGDADSAAVGRDHQYDVMNTDGSVKYPTLRIVKDLPTIVINFLGYNQKINVAKTPDPWAMNATFFADRHIRRAFNFAFDYSTYINNVLYGGGIQANGPIPKGLFGYNPNIPVYTYDLTKAAAELQLAWNYTAKKSVYDNGFTITLYYNAGNTARESAALLFKKGLEAIPGTHGTFTVNVRALDWPVYLATLRAKALPLFFLGWAPDYADPDDYVVPFLHTGQTFPNRMGYSNATLDAMMDAAPGILDPAARLQAYQTISYDAAVYDVPYLWLIQTTTFHVERVWVHGYYFNAMLSGFDYYTFSKS